MLYSVIISTKDRLEHLKRLIQSIKDTATDTHKFIEIIVVDDASRDDTVAFLKLKRIKHIANETSVPVATAWNQGADMASGEYLVFLNDDMLVTPGFLEEQKKMYESMPLVGSLAYKVYDDQGNIQSRGHSFNGLTPYLPAEDTITVDYSDHPFVSKKTWERVGGFTAHGHMYYEDADFGLKIQRAGFYNYYNPNAVLVHQTVGLRTGTEEDKKRREYNESVLQKQSKVNFYKAWEAYLTLKNA